MKDKYSNDCLYSFFYAPIEIEAFGGEVVFVDDGPPNSGQPVLSSIDIIDRLEVPRVQESDGLKRVLEATSMLKAEVGNTVPIIGVAMSPFSLPAMQLGFEKYLELLYFHPDKFNRLMRINQEFCVAWSNAQLAAGATAICYFNPLSSPSMIERGRYLSTGYPVDMETISRINGPTATHLASGIALPVLDDIVKSGSVVLGFSANDDLATIKQAAKNRICLLGNLNALAMVNWSTQMVEDEVKKIINGAGIGGGLILSDNHGEIPWQTPEETLLSIGEAVQRFGTYPLTKEQE